MKIRSGFVSNSSSSSYIVIDNSSKIEHIPEEAYIRDEDGKFELLLPNRNYTYEFGWEECTYQGVMEKLNFAVIQTDYIKNNTSLHQDWMEKIIEVVFRDFEETHPGQSLSINFDFEEKGWNYPYIDHQSSSAEGANTEMFDSVEKLYDFVFNEDSYIQGGNDNC